MLLCENGHDPYVYHVTTTSNLANIRRHGLEPRQPGPEGWPEYDTDDLDDEEDPEPLPPEAFEGRIFAWDDLGVAKTYARGYSTKTVILRIRREDFDWESGQTDFRYLYTTDAIAPEALEVMGKHGSWHHL